MPSSAEPQAAEPESQRSSREWLLRVGPYGSILIGLSAIILVWIGALYFTKSEKLQTEAAARQTAANLTRAFEEQIIRTIREADQTLLSVRDAYVTDPLHFDISQWTHDALYVTGAITQVAVINKEGRLVVSSLPGSSLGIDLSDREHFKIHAGRQIDELYISKPVLGRVSHRWSVQLTRRITLLDGSFGGVVVASLDSQYISQFYRSIDVGKQGVVALIRDDGTVLARTPSVTVSAWKHAMISRITPPANSMQALLCALGGITGEVAENLETTGSFIGRELMKSATADQDVIVRLQSFDRMCQQLTAVAEMLEDCAELIGSDDAPAHKIDSIVAQIPMRQIRHRMQDALAAPGAGADRKETDEEVF